MAVKRELDEQNQPVQTSQDIFADFYGESSSTVEETKKEKIDLYGDV